MQEDKIILQKHRHSEILSNSGKKLSKENKEFLPAGPHYD